MKITETDVKVLLDFLPSFDISNSIFLEDESKELAKTKLTVLDKQENRIKENIKE